jgi:hypothetical protein
MTEQMLREALRETMAASRPPAPMSPAEMVRVARRARVRRHVGWAGVGSVALVATLAVAVAVVPGTPGPASTIGSVPSRYPTPTPPVTASGTAQPFPTGPDGSPMQDRTARTGARYDQGLQLLDKLVQVVPAGYTAPDQPDLRQHQAQFAGRVNGLDVWEYLASVAVANGGGTGQLLADVFTPGNPLSGDSCVLTKQFWGMGGVCQVVSVGTAQVGVVVQPTGDRRLDQWAAFRHPDGTVVVVAQARQLIAGTAPPLAALPLSVPQLATLAVDERFHLS